VKDVIFLNGWQYSSGASFEYLVATRIRRVTRTQGGAILQRRRALELLRKAAKERSAAEQDANFIQCVITELENVGDKQ
jgi:hypothetical protein